VLAIRPMPERRLPVAAAATVVALAAPLFLVAGWRIEGWLLGALLWAGSQALGLVFARRRCAAPGSSPSG
jgi:hypothetical protein